MKTEEAISRLRTALRQLSTNAAIMEPAFLGMEAEIRAIEDALERHAVKLGTTRAELWQELAAHWADDSLIDQEELAALSVTTRDIQERITEVAADLKEHLGDVQIKVLGIWPGRGSVELYFKHRYQAFNSPLGSLTEYFKFDDVRPILRDLRRM